MNRGELRAEVRRILRDTSSNTSEQRFSDVSINGRIDEIQKEISGEVLCIEARNTDANIVAGTAEYALPTLFIGEVAILYKNSDGVFIELKKTTERELDMYNSTWRDLSGTPTHYYKRIGYVGLYPKPDASTTSGLRIDYYKQATSITADASIPLDSIIEMLPYHRYIAVGTARLFMLDEGKSDMAQLLNMEYEKGKALMKAVMQQEIEGTRIINAYEEVRSSPWRTS